MDNEHHDQPASGLPAEKQTGMTASQRITKQITDLADWRGELLARLRSLILAASPGIVEEWKWGSAVWSQNGLVCSAAAFKDHVKVHFFKGAALPDPAGLFNAGLDAKAMRAIDFGPGDKIDESSLTGLIRAAVAHNTPVSGKK
jgi:hypothetical protein